MTLAAKAWTSIAAVIAILGALLFGCAGTIDYWQAWTFLSLYAIFTAVMVVYFGRHDPALLARRMRGGPVAEKERAQKIVQTLTSIFFVSEIVLPALDRRYHWSNTPAWVCIASEVLIFAGLVFVFRVLQENSFAAATIEIQQGQRVISTGPYAILRHPMYAGATPMVMLLPLALGSYWTLPVVTGMFATIIWRLLDEEKFLSANLAGYDAYRRRVRYRLIPFLW